MMKKIIFSCWREKIFAGLIKSLALATFLLLLFILFFIIEESLPLFREITCSDFILGKNWSPADYTGQPSFGIFLIIKATMYVSLLAVSLSLLIGAGTALFISQVLPSEIRLYLRPLINMLAGIPSVIYGFIGLLTVVGFLERLGLAAGESVLAGGIILAIMVLPYIIVNSEETMYKARRKYESSSLALGISHWYMIRHLILPASLKGILLSLVLAFSRAMGETMAVMMVIGNAPIEPHLLSKGQTIASLIALDMGSVPIDSLHYHALFASGAVLLFLLGVINLVFSLLKKYLLE